MPLLEREVPRHLRQNLDEYFRACRDSASSSTPASAPALPMASTPASSCVPCARTPTSCARHAATFRKEIAPRSRTPTSVREQEDLTSDDRHELGAVFEAQIFPVLTPLAVDPSHPFPYISNLSLNLAVQVRDPKTGDERFARVKVPPSCPGSCRSPTRPGSCRSSR